MSSLRERFKRKKPIENAFDQDDSDFGKGQRGPKNNYIRLKDGKNYIRVMPPHEDSLSPFYRLVRSSLYWEYQKGGESIPTSRKVFNARHHGKKLGIRKDIVEEYLQQIAEIQSGMSDKKEDDIKAWRKYIDGYRGDGKWNHGIAPKPRRILYAVEMEKVDGSLEAGDIGLLEVGPMVWEQIVDIVDQMSDDEPAGWEPFSDIDDGIPLVIEYNSNANKPADFYSTSIYMEKGSSKIPAPTPFPLSDELLGEFESMDSLEAMYGKSTYSKEMFDMAVKALELFDNKYGYGVFDREGWPNIVADLAKQIDKSPPNDDSQKADETKKKVAKEKAAKRKSAKRKVVKKEKEDKSDEFGINDLLALMDRNQLKEFNNTVELGVSIKRGMKDDDIRIQLAAEWAMVDDLPFLKETLKEWKSKVSAGDNAQDNYDELDSELNDLMDDLES